jgi:hypothetical protein
MILATILAAKPSTACLMAGGLKLDDIKYASVVVIGRIVDYEIVLDQKVRKERKDRFQESPTSRSKRDNPTFSKSKIANGIASSLCASLHT